MIRAKRRVVRETAEIHGPSGRPFVLRIDESGRTVSIKVKGKRTWYTVTAKQIWSMGAWNKAAEVRAERLAKKRAKGAKP